MFATSFLFIDCGFIIPQDKVFFCDEVTLIKKGLLHWLSSLCNSPITIDLVDF